MTNLQCLEISVLVAVNNTLVVASAGHTHAASSWPCDSLPGISRLTGSQSQGQEEAACTCPSDATTGVLFTAINAVKLPSTVTRSSLTLPLSYYRASTFLPCRISNLR